ncbi:MAG: DUF262 domain-containing protein [Cellvibrionales bacterium]|nr:DUF262 domain-containing protein [Cellvibrionales bacterium]
MDIIPKEITIRDLARDYTDNGSDGVTAYGGRLDVRPAYQREFVYDDKQRAKVIDSVIKGMPLNVMYWADLGHGRFEIIDGQQRTISICQYVANEFRYKDRAFHNLQSDEQAAILDYSISVYQCSGTASERLEWFETVNIAGATLTKQELRNAVYHGPWLADAKGYFSRRGCNAQAIAGAYLKGSAIRQDYLETAIQWHSGGDIEGYMAEHQHASSALDLWLHFEKIVNWIKGNFPNYRREMKGLPWGPIYAEHGERSHNPNELEAEIKKLLIDDEVQNKKGIWRYVLTREPHHLRLRTFTDAMRTQVYEAQNGICAITKKKLPIEKMEADHIIPWSKGGKTEIANCQMVSIEANRRKSNK